MPWQGYDASGTVIVQRDPSLTTTAYSSDANLAAVVNTLYVADISGFSADRTLTLPAAANVGDRVGVYLSVGDTAFEFLITASGGDTLNGVAGGTEWSRVFIANEIVVMRCTVANATWIVETDGRIAQVATMRLSTATTSTAETGGTWYLPTDVGGVFTAQIDNASLIDVATSKFTVRRACRATVTVSSAPKNAIPDGTNYRFTASLNGVTPTGVVVASFVTGAASSVNQYGKANILDLAVDDTLQFMFNAASNNIGCASSTLNTVGMSLVEHF